MERSTENGGVARRRAGAGRSARGRASTKVKPACESLDGRQLLSTVAAAPVALATPSAAAVANAAAALNALDPTDFARLQAELVQAESHSRVTPSQAGQLAQDEAALDQAINLAGAGRNTPSDLLMGVQEVQDRVDDTFLGDTIGPNQDFIAILRGAADEPVSWAQLKKDLSSMSVSPDVVQQTAHEMQVIARAVHVTPEVKRAFWNDYDALNRALGMSPDSDLGPGAADLDALQVYYDGQVNGFIKG